jgi:hypothetical protein
LSPFSIDAEEIVFNGNNILWVFKRLQADKVGQDVFSAHPRPDTAPAKS